MWCCNYHGSLIDKHRGVDFPAEKLLAWKALAEARVKKQMDGYPSPLGWISSIEISKCRLYSMLPKLELGRWTIVYNKPATGMSFLLEMTAGVSSSAYATRWIESSSKDDRFPLDSTAIVRYTTVDQLDQELQVSCVDGALRRHRDGVGLLQNPHDLSLVFCCRGGPWERAYGEDDLQYLCRSIDVDKGTLIALLEYQSRVGKSLIPGEYRFEVFTEEDDDGNEIVRRHEGGEPWIRLVCKLADRDFSVGFGGLASSEIARLMLSLSIAKAREASKTSLTMLVLDISGSGLDAGNFQQLVKLVSSDQYQVVMAFPKNLVKTLLDGDNEDNYKLKEIDYLRGWEFKVLKTEWSS